MSYDFLSDVKNLQYLDPLRILAEPKDLELAVAKFGAGLSANRAEQLAEETRQAAVFCAGMADLWGRLVEFSPGEKWEADAIIRIETAEGAWNVGLLQLTQLPDQSRSTISLQEQQEGREVQRSGEAVPRGRPEPARRA